jgi:hypothetical protein
MMRLGKLSTAVVLGLVVGLALFTTGVFAQDVGQQVERGNISVSAHVAVVNSVMQGATGALLGSAVQRPNDAKTNCGNWGWGNNCGGFNRCGGWNNCFRPRPSFRCSSERECRTVQVCHSSRWGRVCRGIKTCRFRSICRRCFNNNWNGGRGWRGGWNGGPTNAWGVKRH